MGRPVTAQEIYRMHHADGIVKSYQLRDAKYKDNYAAFSKAFPFWGNELALLARLSNV